MVPYFSAFPPTSLSKREDAEVIEGNIASRKCRDAKSSDELACLRMMNTFFRTS